MPTDEETERLDQECKDLYGEPYVWSWDLGQCVIEEPPDEEDDWFSGGGSRVYGDPDEDVIIHESLGTISIGYMVQAAGGAQSSWATLYGSALEKEVSDPKFGIPTPEEEEAGDRTRGPKEVGSLWQSRTRGGGEAGDRTRGPKEVGSLWQSRTRGGGAYVSDTKQDPQGGAGELAADQDPFGQVASQAADSADPDTGEDAAPEQETEYSTSGDKPCENGLPELALGSDFEERENRIGLIDIIAPNTDDWENEVEGSILMRAALGSIAAEFESDFDFDSVNYTDRFEAGQVMEIAYTSFEDLWGEERQIYWDFMNSSDYAPMFSHTYYDGEEEPTDEEQYAEGATYVEYYSGELAALKERFGSDNTWSEILDNTISSLYDELIARSYETSDEFRSRKYDIFKFGNFTSLALGAEIATEESDLMIFAGNPSGTSTTY